MKIRLFRKIFSLDIVLKMLALFLLLTSGLSEDIVDLFNLLLGQFTSSLVKVDLGDLEDKVGESSTNTLNDS